MVDLIVEDGSIVTNANSFVTVAEARTYAENRGVTLPADANAVAIMAIKAMDYLIARTSFFRGDPTDYATQLLPFPRSYLYVGSYRYETDEIPRQIKDAQCQLIIHIQDGVVLLPTSGASDFITREKIGPIETEFSEAVRLAYGNSPTFPLVDALLAPFIGGGFGQLRNYRG